MKQNSYAKVNIFLKIDGKRANYHTLKSRFMIVKTLFDTIEFRKKSDQDLEKDFILEGNFSCSLEKNSIYKAYIELKKFTQNKQIDNFFKDYKIVIDKKIPEFAGLGGGSSNSATFLNMCNSILNLSISKDNLALIGEKIGADVPFFIYEYNSANVTGIGEIVVPYEEDILNIDVFTPKIKSDTTKVYQEFRNNFYKESDNRELLNLNSKEILLNYQAIYLNDLYQPALKLYPELKKYQNLDYFFSGSGSSHFKIKK